MLKRNKHYWKRYCKLVGYCVKRGKPDAYTEKHHIWPVSLGGTNCKTNLVELTAREHYIAHWLLAKSFKHVAIIKKMLHAFGFMANCSKTNAQRQLTARQSERAKMARSLANTGKGNPMYGKTRSEQARKQTSKTLAITNVKQEVKARRSRASKGKNNGMYGKKQTEQSKAKNSKANKISYALSVLETGINRIHKMPATDATISKAYSLILNELTQEVIKWRVEFARFKSG